VPVRSRFNSFIRDRIAGKSSAARDSRERALSDDELTAVWRACHSPDALNPELAGIVTLLILTGQRKGQIGKVMPPSGSDCQNALGNPACFRISLARCRFFVPTSSTIVLPVSGWRQIS
jgi:hypothetical protein